MPECQSCNAPLGADSINLGYTLCHPCRRCSVCGMTISPKEIDFCRSIGLDTPKHMRCLTLTEKPNGTNTDKLIQILNWCCTMPNTETLIKDMSFDDKYLFLQTVQSIAANLSILLRKDKAHFQQALSEQQKQEQIAKRQPKPDPIKKAAAAGIKTTSEKVARQKLSARDKAIAAILPYYPGYEEAAAEIDKQAALQAARRGIQ